MVGVSTRAVRWVGPADALPTARPRAARCRPNRSGRCGSPVCCPVRGAVRVLLVAAALVAALIGAGISQTAGGGRARGVARRGPVRASRCSAPWSTSVRSPWPASALLSLMLGFDQPERTEPVMRRARPIAVWASHGLGRRPPSSRSSCWPGRSAARSPVPAQLWAYLSNIPAGKGLLLSGVCGLASLWLARLSVRHGEKVPAELRVGVALFGLLPVAADRARVQLVLARPGDGLDGAARGRGDRLGRRTRLRW